MALYLSNSSNLGHVALKGLRTIIACERHLLMLLSRLIFKNCFSVFYEYTCVHFICCFGENYLI